MTTAQPSSCRSARGRGVRVERAAGSPCRRAPAFDWSTPALAQTKPWRVRQISRPRVGAHELVRLVEDHLRPGAGPCRAPSASCVRLAAGEDLGEPDDPALGLRDDLVGDGEHVVGPQAALERAGGRAEDRREVVARPDLRDAGQRGERDHEAAGTRRSSTARVRRRRRAARRAPQRSAPRSSGVSTSSPSDGRSQTLHGGARGARERRVARERAGAERHGDRVRRREQQRVGAAAVAVGHDHDRRVAGRAGEQLRRPRRGRRAGQSPGTSSARSAPRSQRPRRSRGWRRPTGRPRPGRATTAAPAALGGSRGERLGGHHDDVVDLRDARVSAASTSVDHRRGELLAIGRRRPRRRAAAWRCANDLTGRTRGGAHGADPKRTPSAASRHAPARVGVAHLDVGDQRGDVVDAARRRRARRSGRRSGPRCRRQLSGWPAQAMNAAVGPFSTAPRTSGETATTGAGVAAAPRASRHREDRADRDHRVGRPDHDRVGRLRAPRAPRASAARASTPRNSTPSPGPWPRSRIMNSWKACQPSAFRTQRAHRARRTSAARCALTSERVRAARRSPRSAARRRRAGGRGAGRRRGRGRRG